MVANKLGDLLLSAGLINEEQLRSAQEHRNKTKERLAVSLVKLGHINEKVLTTFFSKQYGIMAISLDEVTVPVEVALLVPIKLCERHQLVPLSVEGNRLSVAIYDPTNVAAIDDVRFLCNMDINVYLATESSIARHIERTYHGQTSEIKANLETQFTAEREEDSQVEINPAETHHVDGDEGVEKPAIKIINTLLREAIRRKASDIHVEPFENYSRVRIRMDGVLVDVMKIPLNLKTAVPARIKVMANLDISEKRLPQDGRIQVKTKNHRVDIRVSVLPTIYGEKAVLRILDQGGITPNLKTMGFEDDQLALFRQAANQPYGMCLVTGPTGSGKTTTLYAMLSELNRADVNIVTVEDPVEYNIAGINQVQMKDDIGLTFAAALRSFLRQDPDIILVGEIRDQETAEIAIKAALTGHMVFSTLHTNDASSAITRLAHMGVENFLITAAVNLVQAQRLIRRLCTNCRIADERLNETMLREAEVPEEWMASIKPLTGKGCTHCNGTGYKGRCGIFEVMPVTEKLRALIIRGANADMLKTAAMEGGLITLRQAGLLKMYRGETSLQEVLSNSRADRDMARS